MDERHAGDVRRVRWVWGPPGDPLALVELFEDHNHTGWFRLRLALHPAHDTPTRREDLWHHVEEALALPDVGTVTASVREDWWELDFLKARGFAEYDRMWRSALDLEGFDPAPFAPSLERARAAGIEVVTLSHFPWRKEAIGRRLYALMVELLGDVPWSAPTLPWPFELWRERVLPARDFDPDGFYLAVRGEDWIGVTELRPEPGRPDTLHQGLTGVRRAWRGQGVAWALKVRAALDARTRGYRHARATNHQVNRAMLDINARMGYVREPAWIELKRERPRP